MRRSYVIAAVFVFSSALGAFGCGRGHKCAQLEDKMEQDCLKSASSADEKKECTKDRDKNIDECKKMPGDVFDCVEEAANHPDKAAKDTKCDDVMKKYMESQMGGK